MIGGITKGSCFSGCVEYALALKEKNKEARLLYSEGLMTARRKTLLTVSSVSDISTAGSDTGADTSLCLILRKTRSA